MMTGEEEKMNIATDYAGETRYGSSGAVYHIVATRKQTGDAQAAASCGGKKAIFVIGGINKLSTSLATGIDSGT
jgi:hypothetical protein